MKVTARLIFAALILNLTPLAHSYSNIDEFLNYEKLMCVFGKDKFVFQKHEGVDSQSKFQLNIAHYRKTKKTKNFNLLEEAIPYNCKIKSKITLRKIKNIECQSTGSKKRVLILLPFFPYSDVLENVLPRKTVTQIQTYKKKFSKPKYDLSTWNHNKDHVMEGFLKLGAKQLRTRKMHCFHQKMELSTEL